VSRVTPPAILLPSAAKQLIFVSKNYILVALDLEFYQKESIVPSANVMVSSNKLR
jgi:hypothetical protein